MTDAEPTPATPPIAARRDHLRTLHGDEFVDAYEWLREKENPEVIAYLEAENAYTEAVTEGQAELRRDIFDEIKARTQETDLSVPERMTHTDGSAYWYYARTVEGQDYAIHCRVPADGDTPPDVSGEIAGEEVLLDGNTEAAGHEFFALGAFEVSPDGRRLAWLVDNAGDERFELRVKDLASGELLADRLTDLGYGLTWVGEEWLFYVRVDAAWRPHQIWRHRLGTDAAGDALVIQEDDERFWLDCWESRDRRWVVFAMGSKITGEAHLLSVDDPEGTPHVVRPRVEGLDYSVEVAGDRLLVVHNEGALDYALAEAPLDSPAAWTPVIEGAEGVRISGVDAYRDFAVVSLRRDGLRSVRVLPRDAQGNFADGRDLAFDEPVYDVVAPGGAEYVTDRFRIIYNSLVTPSTVIEVDAATLAQTVLKRTPVLDDPRRGAYDPAEYVCERAWATAADGARIPISVVRRADVPLDGTAPCLLYGYGSYETSIPPVFSIARLPLLERGVVYAIAHIRGGGEMGRGWYDNGKMATKRNTFTDFIACAEHLCDHGYTSPAVLAAEGRSAGGLLMGAVANIAPDMFRAIHAGVPFVDALTSMTMPELPLTVTEWEEWGDPVHDAEAYAYMKSYTPYENVQARPYPAILATTSLNDTRVLYVEPAKWVAQLRHTLPASDEVLLQTEMVAGHGGVSGRYGRWEQAAFELAWLLTALGVDETERAAS